MNFKAVLALPKTARFAQTHKSISFIWIVWSTLCICYGIKHYAINDIVKKKRKKGLPILALRVTKFRVWSFIMIHVLAVWNIFFDIFHVDLHGTLAIFASIFHGSFWKKIFFEEISDCAHWNTKTMILLLTAFMI